MLSCTFSVFWTTVTSQTSSEKRRTNRHTVKPTVYVWLKSGIRKRVAHASVFSHGSGAPTRILRVRGRRLREEFLS